MTLSDDPIQQEKDDALIQSLRLALIPGVGPRIRRALLDRFGSPESVFDAAPDELRTVPGVGPKLLRKIVAAPDEIDPESQIALCRENNVAIVTEADEAYPRMLREIHDPPAALFVRGELLPQDALAIAIVGTRHATQYGLRQAGQLGSSLARAGLTVVSGLARGVDAAAHRGAIEAGGRTLAVLGSGVLNIYPPEHKDLAEQVIAHGALLSESPPLMAPMSGTFPQRNRIISGLSLGAVIVEAAERSGALITARLATEQDRECSPCPAGSTRAPPAAATA